MNHLPTSSSQPELGQGTAVTRSRYHTVARMLILGCVFGISSMAGAAQPADEEVKIWEFSPYEVAIWYAFDASVDLSQVAREECLRQMQANLQRSYRAAWRSQVAPLSPEWTGLISRNFEDFTLADLSRNELVIVVALKHPDTRTIRTFEAALEGLSELSVTDAVMQKLETNLRRFDLPQDSPASQLVAKCRVDAAGLESIAAKLTSAEIAAAILPRAALPEVQDAVRPLITTLPWQTDSVLREQDKVFFVCIGQEGAHYRFRVRELDCPMQYLGPSFSGVAASWSHAPRVMSHVISQAFAPIARVEDAETFSANLRLRAGGLIVAEDNPALVKVGDLMQPIVRRDDRNGMPTLLQPLEFTYAAITASDRVKMEANVYTYSGGPGLQGRKNRRTQRILLRVRPRVEETDLRIVVRGTDTPQSGCFIYQKDLMTGEFELLGRTDWRGQFLVPVPDAFGQFLPEAVRKSRLLAKREAERKAAEAAAAEANRVANGDSPAEPTGEEPAQNEVAEVERFEVPDPQEDPDALPLNYPLLQLYLKNGDNVVAKLPLVPGLQELEVAELLDDSRRLQAEAFVKGFQGEILDLIGLRNLYAAQIELHLKEKQLEQAEEKLEEMRLLDNYDKMADRLDRIQREMLDEQDGKIPLGAKNRIDRMFSTTRNMLQKYLQDNLLRDSEQAVSQASSGSPPAEAPSEPAEATGAQ